MNFKVQRRIKPNEELPPHNPGTGDDQDKVSFTCIAFVPTPDGLKHQFANYDYRTGLWDYTDFEDTLVKDFHHPPLYWIPMFDEFTGESVRGDDYYQRRLEY